MPEPGPRPSTGITRLPRYHGPLRLPQGPRLTISDHPGWWLRTTTSVDLARCLENRVRMLTPLPRLERTGSSIDCSPAPQRPSPSGRRVGSSEKLSRPAQGSLRFGLRTCTLVAPRTSPEAPVGDLSPQLLQWLPGRIDNSPDGTSTRWPSRPRRSLPIPLSTLTSFRAALPGDSPGDSIQASGSSDGSESWPAGQGLLPQQVRRPVQRRQPVRRDPHHDHVPGSPRQGVRGVGVPGGGSEEARAEALRARPIHRGRHQEHAHAIPEVLGG